MRGVGERGVEDGVVMRDEAGIEFGDDGRDEGVREGDFEQKMGVRREDNVESCWTSRKQSANEA